MKLPRPLRWLSSWFVWLGLLIVALVMLIELSIRSLRRERNQERLHAIDESLRRGLEPVERQRELAVERADPRERLVEQQREEQAIEIQLDVIADDIEAVLGRWR